VVPDADGFERLALYVVPSGADTNLDEVEAHARAGLPQHSWPKWVRTVDELPRTPTGKVQRFRLKEMLQAELFGPAHAAASAEPAMEPPAAADAPQPAA